MFHAGRRWLNHVDKLKWESILRKGQLTENSIEKRQQFDIDQ